jgi:C1A family cysteine protease
MQLFEQFKATHGKAYSSEEEHAYRFSVFKQNIALTELLNEGEDGTPYGVTKFSDLTRDEFKQTYLMDPEIVKENMKGLRSVARAADVDSLPQDLPTSFDWRDQNAVTPVKDQAQCGSCWAFSTTENIESVSFLQGNKPLTKLSVQQIVSCDTTDGGCNGGDLPTAYKYVMSAGGLETEADYPYTSGGGDTGSCKFQNKIAATIDGFEYATTNRNETAMQVYMQAHAPLAICVDAGTWQFYTGGVVKNFCGKQLDHCVQLVGWNTDSSSNIPYWIVRNSWNTNWGEQGYIMSSAIKICVALPKKLLLLTFTK